MGPDLLASLENACLEAIGLPIFEEQGKIASGSAFLWRGRGSCMVKAPHRSKRHAKLDCSFPPKGPPSQLHHRFGHARQSPPSLKIKVLIAKRPLRTCFITNRANTIGYLSFLHGDLIHSLLYRPLEAH